MCLPACIATTGLKKIGFRSAMFFVLAGFFLQASPCLGGIREETWSSKKSSHFTVYYKTQGTGDYADAVLKSAEDYYETITDALGFRRFEFWTWDKTCKIYLYPSSTEYYVETRQPAWSGASVHVKEKVIQTFLNQDSFNETILPHEMTHLILREFVGYTTSLPLWLDEGIASLSEKQHDWYLTFSRVLVKSSVFIPLEKLTEINKEGLVMPGVFYAEAASVVSFLLETYGRDKFIDYCRKLRDNKDWKKSLKEVYGFQSLSEMNEKWISFLSAG